jgi:hypothetical protein
MVYACIFGAIFALMPESIRNGWITTAPLSQFTLGDVLIALACVLLA